MSEKQEKILKTFERVLPKISEEDQSYLLGYGEGVAAKLEKKESEEEENGE